MSEVIAFIPARCGSKSINMKNVRPFCGRPLIYWNLEALQQVAGVDRVVVATDCDEITEVVEGLGFSKVEVYRRDPENAQDHSSTESVMLEFIQREKLGPEDIFMLVQLTSPMTGAEHFAGGLEHFRETGADALLSAVRSKRFYWTENGESINYDYLNRPLRQNFPGQMLENGAFYISTVKAVNASGNRLSGKIAVYEMPEYTSIELDEPIDWLIGEKLMEHYRLQPAIAPDFSRVKLVVSDVDGVMTDGSMYYTENGDEIKRFHTYDGMAFKLMQAKGIKTALITSEDTAMVANRARKLKIDYLYQGRLHGGKLQAIEEICKQEGISLEEVVYIGDDINCREALSAVGFAFCPANALPEIKALPNIIQLARKGGEGAVREMYERFLRQISAG